MMMMPLLLNVELSYIFFYFGGPSQLTTCQVDPAAELHQGAQGDLHQCQGKPQKGESPKKKPDHQVYAISNVQVKKPVVKEWCYKPSDLKSPSTRLALSQFFSN